MGFFGELGTQVKELYGRLTVSQKAAFVLLVALVVVFMVWFAGWGGEEDYVALTAQPADGAERSAAMSRLAERGIDVRERGGVLEVARGEQSRALAVLAEAGALPSDFSRLDRATSGKQGIFKTAEDSRYDREVMLAEYLGNVIQHMDGIRMAQVVFDVPTPYEGFMREGKGTASVMVWLKDREGKLNRQQVEGIASLVSGALRSVPKENVGIVDGQGRPYRVRGSESPAGLVSERYEEELAYEEYLTQKVVGMLSYLGQVKVFVDAEIDFTQKSTHTREVDPNAAEAVTSSRKVTTEKTTDPIKTGTEGAEGTAVAGGTVEKHVTEERTMATEFSTTETKLEEPPGKILDMSVTALVDRDGVIAQLASEGVTVGTEAGGEELNEKLSEMQAFIANGLRMTDVTKVVVKAVSFPKAPIPEPPIEVEGMTVTWEKYGTSLVLGVLVVAAMVLLWRMVKRPVEMRLDAGSGSALGLATGDETLLANLSGVDAETMRRTRLETRVKEMIEENPDDAAKLVTRWVNTES